MQCCTEHVGPYSHLRSLNSNDLTNNRDNIIILHIDLTYPPHSHSSHPLSQLPRSLQITVSTYTIIIIIYNSNIILVDLIYGFPIYFHTGDDGYQDK